MRNILRELKQSEAEIQSCPVSPAHLTEMLKLVDNNTISGNIAKKVFDEMYATGKMPEEIVRDRAFVEMNAQSRVFLESCVL